LRDPSGGLFLEGFNDARQFECFGVPDAVTPVEFMEMGDAEAVKTEDLLTEPLVVADEQRLRAGPGVGDLQHLQEGGHIFIQVGLVVEDLHEVKDHIGFGNLELFKEGFEVIVDSQEGDLVTQSQQGAVDVILGVHVLWVGELLFEVVAALCDVRHVKEHENLEVFLHSGPLG